MHKASSQQKKKMKNRPVMPRTAGLSTLSEMTKKMTKAGLDPSRIIERAQLLAKARGAERKRKRDEDENMDLDGGEDGEEQDWMDVDDDGDDSPRKRRKGVNGHAQVVLHKKRAPKTDRTTIGMRDASVCLLKPVPIVVLY
jgi:nucleolar GTP-binding protein